MANVLSSTEIAGFMQCIVDADPIDGAGTPASIGTIAQVESSMTRWIKDGVGDTDWNLYTTEGQSISLEAGADILISGSLLTPVVFNTIDRLDSTTFGFTAGTSDIEVKRNSMLDAAGQFSVVFTTGGNNNSRTKARGFLYQDPINGGAGPWTSIRGTRGWGYHRILAAGDDTIALSRGIHVTAGTYLRYAVQRINGAGALMLDGEGCSLTLKRTGQ